VNEATAEVEYVLIHRRAAWGGLLECPVRAVFVVEGLVLAQGVEEVALVPDQGPVQEFDAAGLYPALHERVHPRYSDAGGDDLHAGIGHQGVEGGCELRVAVSDQELRLAARILEVHEEVATELHDPLRAGVCGGAEDPDAPGGVLNDSEGVQTRPVRVRTSKRSQASRAWAWLRRKSAQVVLSRSGAGGMP